MRHFLAEHCNSVLSDAGIAGKQLEGDGWSVAPPCPFCRRSYLCHCQWQLFAFIFQSCLDLTGNYQNHSDCALMLLGGKFCNCNYWLNQRPTFLGGSAVLTEVYWTPWKINFAVECLNYLIKCRVWSTRFVQSLKENGLEICLTNPTVCHVVQFWS